MSRKSPAASPDRAPSRLTAWVDRHFYNAFYLLVGLLPTFLGLFDRRALQVPFVVFSLLVVLRLMRDADLCSRMLVQLRRAPFIVFALFVGLLAVYAAVTVFVDPGRAGMLGKPLAVALGGILVAFVLVDYRQIDGHRLAMWMCWGGIAGFVGVLFLSAWGHGFEMAGMPQSFSPPIPVSVVALNDELKILATFLFFAAAGLAWVRGRYVFAVLSALAILTLSFLTTGFSFGADGIATVTRAFSETVNFGLPVALAVLGLAVAAPQLMTNAIFAGLGALLLFAPWIFQLWFNLIQKLELPRAGKFLERGEIWDAVATQSLKAPVFGHGLESCRYDNIVQHARVHFKGDHIWHPHNMFLQVWLDMGLIGVLPVLALIFFCWRFVSGLPSESRPMILAGITMVAIFAVATHSVWQTWVIALLMLVAAHVALQKLRSA